MLILELVLIILYNNIDVRLLTHWFYNCIKANALVVLIEWLYFEYYACGFVTGMSLIYLATHSKKWILAISNLTCTGIIRNYISLINIIRKIN